MPITTKGYVPPATPGEKAATEFASETGDVMDDAPKARVRARFRVGSVVQMPDGGEYVSFFADTEHQEWAKYTPSGTLMMNITAEGAIGTFKNGQVYDLAFTLAD